MSAFDLESLLSPLPGEAPCGADLVYDPVFAELERAGAGRPEQEYGDTRIAAVPPDWPEVQALALQLLGRSRDLRLAVWCTRSGARLGGLTGAMHGLQLVRGLLERHWLAVHPQLDAEDDNDATARLNAIAPLAALEAGLADFRAARLTPDRVSLTVRDIELAIGRVKAAAGEAAPTEEGVIAGLRDAMRRHPALADTMQAAHGIVAGITARVDEQLGPVGGLDLLPLQRLLKPLDDAARMARGDAAAPERGAPDAAGAPAVAGGIASRDDVVRTLERACEWIERNEPSHPAPLLIRRAQRLMTKSFVDIIRDIAPDGLGQLEKVAGERFDT